MKTFDHYCSGLRPNQDDANARIVHIAKTVEILPLRPDEEQTPFRRDAIAVIYLEGKYEDPEHKAFLKYADGCIHLWIPEESNDHRALVYFEGRITDSSLTTRFSVGPLGAGYTVRCCFSLKWGHMICLPSDSECDKYIHFFRFQKTEEWATQAGYEFKKVTEECFGERSGRSFKESDYLLLAEQEKLKHGGWETYCDPRSGDLWARRRN